MNSLNELYPKIKILILPYKDIRKAKFASDVFKSFFHYVYPNFQYSNQFIDTGHITNKFIGIDNFKENYYFHFNKNYILEKTEFNNLSTAKILLKRNEIDLIKNLYFKKNSGLRKFFKKVIY